MKHENIRVVVKHNSLNTIVLGYGGSLYVALEIASSLNRAGFSTCIKTHLPRGIAYNILSNAIEYYGLKKDELKNVEIECKDEDDAILFNALGDALSGKSHIAYFHYPVFSNPRTYYPLIPSFYEPFTRQYMWLNRMFKNVLLRDLRIALFNSSFTYKYLKKYLKGVIKAIVYPPANLIQFYKMEPLSFDEREPIILTVSRITYEKNPFNVILLAWILEKLGLRDWRVVWAGSYGKFSRRIISEVYTAASKLGLDPYIEFLVNIPRSELVELYRRAYLYVHFTEYEHFGISIIEALAAGTPVVIPRSSGFWRDFGNIVSPAALPFSDVTELYRMVKKLIEKPRIWIHASTLGRSIAWYFSRYRFHREITKYFLILLKLLGMKKNRGTE
ncbi:MAG: glycosyltransferase family 4 protein [Thermoprotei archaeon]